jgi:hypothetical protein
MPCGKAEIAVDCSFCGEAALVVNFDGKTIIRPRRFSKCKFYRASGRGKSDVCKTEILESESKAVAEWNDFQNARFEWSRKLQS